MPTFEFVIEEDTESGEVVDVEFEVYCDKCGAGLCYQSIGSNSNRRHYPRVTVSPCEACLEAERLEGHGEGYEEGHTDGFSSGFEEGEAVGLEHSENQFD